MNILIIDDEGTEGFSGSLKNFLTTQGHSVTVIDDPQNGIDTMSNKFDLVFIDFLFSKDPNVKTGNQVGLEIRRKCPLAAMVLITAFGSDHIRDFIYVGFDDYYDKNNDGSTDEVRNERKQNCIEISLNNAQKRIKSSFSGNELESVKIRLSYIKKAVDQLTIITSQSQLTKKVVELMQQEGHNDIGNTYNSLSIFFKLKDKQNNYTENALKTRQILKENYDDWKGTVTSYSPLKKIKREFFIS
jgi:DNA-binding response OmpR family regulator